MNAPEAWVTIAEVAKHLGVTERTVQTWVRERDLPAHKVGGEGPHRTPVRFLLSEVDTWLRGAAA